LLPVAISAIGKLAGTLYFFAGIGLIAIIDFLVPEIENPHRPVDSIVYSNHDSEAHDKTVPSSTPELIFNEIKQPPVSSLNSRSGHGNLVKFQHHGGFLFPHRSRNQLHHRNSEENQAMPRLWKLSLMTVIAITIHNFPEGIASFGIALFNIKLGVFIASAIAIHNIPEGISVAIPIFYATNSRKKAVLFSFLSGLAEPLGAVVGYLILFPFLSPAVLAGLSAFVAGIMIYISIDEILPNAHQYEQGHQTIIGLILGMAVMAVSLLFL
jgi:zinc transporter ZupT